MNFIEYVRQQIAWSTRTFGPGKRKKGVMDHIRKELKELEEATDPADELGEWIDIITLAVDGAWRTGASAKQVAIALFNKQTKNINRVWPDWRTMSEDEAIEHDRSVDQPGWAGPTEGNQPPGVDLSGLRQAAQKFFEVGEKGKGLLPPNQKDCELCGNLLVLSRNGAWFHYDSGMQYCPTES